MKLISLALAACVSATAYSGTYTVTGVTWLGASTGGATIAVAGNSATYTMIGGASTTLGSARAHMVIQGVLTWAVQWTPSFPGDPVPTGVAGVCKAVGHDYALANCGHSPSSGGDALTTVMDLFLTGQAHQTSMGFGPVTSGTMTDGSTNLAVGTGPFALVSPGVYQGQVNWTVNVTADATVAVAGPIPVLAAGSANSKVALSLTSIAGQNL